jgi:hypothetical protein
MSGIEIIPHNPEDQSGHLDVVFRPEATDEEIDQIVAEHDCTIDRMERHPDYVVATVALPEGKNEQDVANEFIQDPFVLSTNRGPIFEYSE